MARNKYPGTCYCCGSHVPSGYGHFEKIRGAKGWRVKCVKCASGRVLTDKDPGVLWAKQAFEEERLAKARCDRETHFYTPH